MPNIFISHSTEDKAEAELLCNTLESNGYTCWIAPRDIPAGVEWAGAITEGLQKADAVVLMFSDTSNESQHVLREMTLTVHQNKPLLPVRIEPGEPSGSMAYYLATCQWYDATQGGIALHRQGIMDRVQALLQQPAKPAGLVMAGFMPFSQSPYASWGQRLGAWFIDFLIIIIGYGLFTSIMGEQHNFVSLTLWIIYGIAFESSAWQATPGKRALGLKVTDARGEKLSAGAVIIRRLAQMLSAVILGIGFLMPAFTQYRQALHDMIAKAYVIKSK